MSIDKDTVFSIAKLARISIDEGQAHSLVAELNNILGWIEQLDAVDTAGVEPMTSVVEMQLPMREDEVTDGGYPEEIIKNAPESVDHYFVVPKVVE